ncbi:MAG: hypothetical protein WCX84_07365 [Syntrophales bacterium]
MPPTRSRPRGHPAQVLDMTGHDDKCPRAMRVGIAVAIREATAHRPRTIAHNRKRKKIKTGGERGKNGNGKGKIVREDILTHNEME